MKLFGQNLIRQTQWQDLPQAIIQSLHKLNIEQAAIWFKDEETEICRLTAQSGHWNLPLPPCFLIPPLIREQPGQILRVNTPHHSLPPWLSNFQEHSSIRLVGLLGQGELIGVLVLGSRWHEEIYTERDLEIMELVVQQISLFC
ncbi:MAG: GAF domain-containing protein [Chloroflexi bacterium]|nr:GAF domain-containing protein [Chloroflexota bacterium]